MLVAFLLVARGFKIGIKSNLQIWNCVLPVASCFCGLARNRTWIWSFGNSYTIHCTTGPFYIN